MDELPTITEIAANLIALCDDLNFHNLDALAQDERNALNEAIAYLRDALTQLETIQDT